MEIAREGLVSLTVSYSESPDCSKCVQSVAPAQRASITIDINTIAIAATNKVRLLYRVVKVANIRMLLVIVNCIYTVLTSRSAILLRLTHQQACRRRTIYQMSSCEYEGAYQIYYQGVLYDEATPRSR